MPHRVWNKGLRVPVEERFSSKYVVTTSGCWEWRGSKDSDGYGHLENWDLRRPEKAHRVSWRIHFGEIPEGIKVLHKCDNPPCVNPDHLFLGTTKDNSRDMVSKKRWRGFGKEQRLTLDVAREIRASNEPQHILAKRYGVHSRSILSVRRGETFKETT